MEYKSYSQDTGPIRSKRQSVNPDSTTVSGVQRAYGFGLEPPPTRLVTVQVVKT